MYREWYVRHFIEPALEHLGAYPTMMCPWYIQVSGPGISIGDSVTVIAEPGNRTVLGVWGSDQDSGRIDIGNSVLISPGVRISACNEIRIGNSCMMANGVYITDSDWHGIYDRVERPSEHTPVIIEDNVWIGDRATILKGVRIGENSIVGANSVVSRDVPANVVVAGNPAVVVKELDPTRGFIKREDFFANPAALRKEYDNIDRMVLQQNGFFNWLRALIWPRRGD
jgi:acetyltransferase-like isoleucine patch superfamily enzyme